MVGQSMRRQFPRAYVAPKYPKMWTKIYPIFENWELFWELRIFLRIDLGGSEISKIIWLAKLTGFLSVYTPPKDTR